VGEIEDHEVAGPGVGCNKRSALHRFPVSLRGTPTATSPR
jgi:hypothetical protein